MGVAILIVFGLFCLCMCLAVYWNCIIFPEDIKIELDLTDIDNVY